MDPDDEDFEEESSFQPVCSSVGFGNNHSRSGKRLLSQICKKCHKFESTCFVTFILFRSYVSKNSYPIIYSNQCLLDHA